MPKFFLQVNTFVCVRSIHAIYLSVNCEFNSFHRTFNLTLRSLYEICKEIVLFGFYVIFHRRDQLFRCMRKVQMPANNFHVE